MKKLVFPSIVIVASLACSWLIYKFIILHSGPFGWDEAEHSIRGLVIAYDLKQHDWLSFLYDTYRQVYWPPLHSWFTGIAFLVAGTGAVTARTVSLIAYVVAAVLLYLTANQMRQQKREIAGIVASTLFLTSPGLIPLTAKSMLEIPGLLAIIITFLIYFKLINNDFPPRKYVILGLGITFTYFVKNKLRYLTHFNHHCHSAH